MENNKTVPAFIYNAEGIEITIKVNKFEFSKQNPVKPGFIASIIQSLPPELLLMFASKINSFMDGMNNASTEEKTEIVTFIDPDKKSIDHLFDYHERLGELIVTGMNKLNLSEDRFQVSIQVNEELPIEIPGSFEGSVIQFLVENGYMNKTINTIRLIYQ